MSILEWFKGKETQPSGSAQHTDALHDEFHKTVVTYGVTNRKLSTDGKSLEDSRFSSPLDNQVHYFSQTVELTGKPGDWHAQTAAAPQVISKDQFDAGVSAQVKEAQGKLGVYTHGIRNGVGDAGRRSAELAADTGKPFITEDWASTKAFGFLYAGHQEKLDDRASFLSQGMIDNSVEDLAKKFGAANIDMVAHSRGSMNQIRALADLQNNGLGSVHSATFAHSDVDVSDFQMALPSFQKATGHINVLYNPKDRALRLSELQRFGTVALFGEKDGIEQSARLGRIGLTPGVAGDRNSYNASNVPNYFSIARDANKDTVGHDFAPSLVASMIAKPNNYNSFSSLKTPSELTPPSYLLSPMARLGHVAAAVPQYAVRVLSPARKMTDIVSASPEVQRYLVGSTQFAWASEPADPISL